MSSLHNIVNIDYKFHLGFSFVIRLVLIIYGIYHDNYNTVKYTDVDYSVFTDASRHVLNNRSPYDRHTYRYSPLLAITLIPNILIHHSFGKILFSCIDILVALLIRLIVKSTLKEYECYKQKKDLKALTNTAANQLNFKSIGYKCKKKYTKHKTSASVKKAKVPKSEHDKMADISMIVWLYNPMTMAIATRGNCDSLAGLFVLATLYFLQCKHQYFIAGLVHGVSIHFRLYPIIYSLTMFMFLSNFSIYTTVDRYLLNKSDVKAVESNSNKKYIKNLENTIMKNTDNNKSVSEYMHTKKKTIFKWEYLYYLIPNIDQLNLISGCILSLTALTSIFYYLYGYQFIFETYIYHLVRKDTRHNFSLYFYLTYLTAWVRNIGLWQKALIILPQLVLLLVFSIRYGLNKYCLNFSILVQTVVMVIYNSVLTSQYFVWVLAILPLCIWQIRMPLKTVFWLVLIWFTAQATWLLPAYLLEFLGQNTFIFIWIQSVALFCANIAILGRMIKHFTPNDKPKSN